MIHYREEQKRLQLDGASTSCEKLTYNFDSVVMMTYCDKRLPKTLRNLHLSLEAAPQPDIKTKHEGLEGL